MKFLRSKLFISLVLIVMAGVLAFYMLPKLYGGQAEMLTIVTLKSDVELGMQITGSMLETKTVGKYGVNSAVIQDKDAIIGKYAVKDIDARQYLYSDMFVPTFIEVNGAVDTLLKPGDRIQSVSVKTLAASVGGIIKPGDIVDVLTVKRQETVMGEYGPVEDDAVEMEQQEVMRNIMVYQVFNSAGEDITELSRRWMTMVEAGDGSEEDFDASLIPAAINLIVTEEQQAIIVANQEQTGAVHLVLHPTIPDATPGMGTPVQPTTPVAPDAAPVDPTDAPVDVTGDTAE